MVDWKEEMTKEAMDEFDVGEDAKHVVRNIQDKDLKIENFRRQLSDREAQIERFEGEAKSAFDRVVEKKEYFEEKLEDEDFKEDMEKNTVDGDVVRKFIGLMDAYSELVGAVISQREIGLNTLDGIKLLVEEQQLRHDQNFVLENTKELNENKLEEIREYKQFAQSQMEELLSRVDMRVDREGIKEEVKEEVVDELYADKSGVDNPERYLSEDEETYECPECGKSFEHDRGLKTHIGMEHS